MFKHYCNLQIEHIVLAQKHDTVFEFEGIYGISIWHCKNMFSNFPYALTSRLGILIWSSLLSEVSVHSWETSSLVWSLLSDGRVVSDERHYTVTIISCSLISVEALYKDEMIIQLIMGWLNSTYNSYKIIHNSWP